MEYMSLLMHASAHGQLSIEVEMLLDQGAQVNLQTSLGNSALVFAVAAASPHSPKNGDPDIVTALLRAGAATKLGDRSGDTAMAVKLSCPTEVIRARW